MLAHATGPDINGLRTSDDIAKRATEITDHITPVLASKPRRSRIGATDCGVAPRLFFYSRQTSHQFILDKSTRPWQLTGALKQSPGQNANINAVTPCFPCFELCAKPPVYGSREEGSRSEDGHEKRDVTVES
jgi:hypothetical protein